MNRIRMQLHEVVESELPSSCSTVAMGGQSTWRSAVT